MLKAVRRGSLGNPREFILRIARLVSSPMTATSLRGRRFRNTERLTIRGGKIVEAEVYFGWPLPHDAPDGGYVTSGA